MPIGSQENVFSGKRYTTPFHLCIKQREIWNGLRRKSSPYKTSPFHKMNLKILSIPLLFLGISMRSSGFGVFQNPHIDSKIICDEKSCRGEYNGAEFVEGADIAHQFSNKMARRVGEKLKQLYDQANYSKVDFSKIQMSTKGMGSGTVTYALDIPFISVSEKCEAHTSFDHCGGWNHKPTIQSRKRQLQKALFEGEDLYISDLKTTKEGLQEYWIQWRNKLKQAECVPN